MRRASTIAAAAVFIAGSLGGQSAAASVLPVCGDETGSAGIPGETCEVDAVADCIEGTALIEYVADVDADTVDIVWTNTPGEDLILTEQPLEGVLDWPEPSAQTATLVFGDNPDLAVDVVNPCEAEEGVAPVSNPRPTAVSGGVSGVLAATGAAGPALAIGAGALLVGGTSLVLVRRARRDGV
jgi:LPXTG-motif cell wall-anchored protein